MRPSILGLAAVLVAGCHHDTPSPRPSAVLAEGACPSGDDYAVSEDCRAWFWSARDRAIGDAIDDDLRRERLGGFELCPAPAALVRWSRESTYRAYLDRIGDTGDQPLAVETSFELDGYTAYRKAVAPTIGAERRALVSGELAIPVDDVASHLDELLFPNGEPDQLDTLARAFGWLFGWELVLPDDPEIASAPWARWVYAPRLVLSDPTGYYESTSGVLVSAFYRAPGAAEPHVLTVIARPGSRSSWQTAPLAQLEDCRLTPGDTFVTLCMGLPST